MGVWLSDMDIPMIVLYHNNLNLILTCDHNEHVIISDGIHNWGGIQGNA